MTSIRLFRALTALSVLSLSYGSAYAGSPIPTLSEWGLVALAGGLTALGARMVWRKKR